MGLLLFNSERYLLATSTTMLATPIIIRAREPVMARRSPQPRSHRHPGQARRERAAAREVRFVMVGDLSAVSRRPGGDYRVGSVPPTVDGREIE
jgi:hypothetical protein